MSLNNNTEKENKIMAKLKTLDEIYESLTFQDSMILQYYKLELHKYPSGVLKPLRVILSDLAEMLDNYVTAAAYKDSIGKLKKIGLYGN